MAVFSLNYWLDASGLESSTTIATLAREQREGDVLVSSSQFDQRAWARTRISGGTCPDVLILGSSTVGELSSEMFPGRRVLNAWVPGPTLEDFEALSAVLRRVECHPRLLVVGVDPWWLGNPEVDDRRWMSLLDDYLAFDPSRTLPSTLALRAQVFWARFQERMTFTTTRESLRLLLGRFRVGDAGARLVHTSPPGVCAAAHAELYTHLFDGSTFECPVWALGDDERRQVAAGYFAKNMHSMASWVEIAWGRMERLRRLRDEWATHADAVVFVGMPYHPTTFRELRARPRTLENLETLDRALKGMETARVRFVNLRDPAKVPCDDREFQDSHHAGPACVRKVALALSGKESEGAGDEARVNAAR